MRAQRKVRWGWIAAIFALPVLVLSSLVFAARVAWTVRESYGQAAMQKRLDALEATGVAIDDASAEAVYLERTSPDHTDRWLAVMEEFESEEFKQSQTGVSNFDPQLAEVPFEASGQWSSETATRRFIETHQPLVKEIRELCQYREPVRFPYFFDSLNTLLPYTQHMRDVGRLLWTDGQIAIRDRDAARVRSNIEALFDSSQVCSAEPWAVSQLVCIAIETMALDLLKVALENDCLTLEDLNKLLPRLIEESELHDEWQLMMEGERGTALPCFTEPQRAGVDGKVIPPRGWDCIIYMDLIDKALAIDTSSLDSLLAGARRLQAEFKESQLHGGWLRMADGIITGAIAPAFQVLSETLVTNRTSNRLAAHAVAVAIFHKSHGHWPADLSEVELPEADLAPPGGKPFGYRIEEDGRACLWGFSLRFSQSTPPEPPSLDVPAGDLEKFLPCIWYIAHD